MLFHPSPKAPVVFRGTMYRPAKSLACCSSSSWRSSSTWAAENRWILGSCWVTLSSTYKKPVNMAVDRWLTHQKLWFSIGILVYQRVNSQQIHHMKPPNPKLSQLFLVESCWIPCVISMFMGLAVRFHPPRSNPLSSTKINSCNKTKHLKSPEINISIHHMSI